MLQLVINFAPQIEHHVLADGVQQHGLKIRKDEAEKLRGHVHEGEQSQAVGLARNDVPVDRVLSKFRLQDAEQIQYQRQHQRGNQKLHVRLQIAQQAAR